MTRIFFALAIITPTTVSILVAAYLAVNHIEGWGWFLFIGFCCAGGSIKYNEKKDSKKNGDDNA